MLWTSAWRPVAIFVFPGRSASMFDPTHRKVRDGWGTVDCPRRALAEPDWIESFRGLISRFPTSLDRGTEEQVSFKSRRKSSGTD
jgi:hypothetical protein